MYGSSVKVYQFKAKDFKLISYPFFLVDWVIRRKILQLITWKKAWLNGYVYDFSVYYNNIDTDNICNIRIYLMKNVT